MQTPNQTAQIDALRALAEGRLSAWRGLDPSCSRADAEAAFGPGYPGPDGMGSVEGGGMAFRRYPPNGPYDGLMVWLQGDRVAVVQIHQPVVAAAEIESLGPPEDTMPSELRISAVQKIYASRGLTLHIDPEGKLFRTYAYPATTPAEFKQSWMARVKTRRIRLQD